MWFKTRDPGAYAEFFWDRHSTNVSTVNSGSISWYFVKKNRVQLEMACVSLCITLFLKNGLDCSNSYL